MQGFLLNLKLVKYLVMKKFLASFLVPIIVLLVYFVYIFYVNPIKYSLISPLPDFLFISQNSQASTLNLWEPDIDDLLEGKDKPDVTATSVLIYDLTTKKTTYSKNPRMKVPLASLTKIMTAVIALENKKKDDKYIVKKEDLVGEDSMGLTEGEVLTLEELLYGLILHSGNDAAETIASNYPNGRTSFIKAMNDKAKALGLKDTNFTNPSGLEGDGVQYTTTYDLLVMTNFALTNFPLFAKIAETFEYTIPQNLTHKEFYMQNETNLLSTYPGVKGVKTGYTPEAGLCLISYLDYKGHKIIAILLGSSNRRDEMKELLDYSLNVQGITPPKHS